MTTRQSFTRRQNRSTMKPLSLGASSASKAFVVSIDWTTEPVVKYIAHTDTTLTVIEALVRGDQLLESRHFEYKVAAGEIIYFARSASHPGYYYLVRWAGTRWNCACAAGFNHKACHHQSDTNQFVLDEIMAARANETCDAVIEALDRIAASFGGVQPTRAAIA